MKKRVIAGLLLAAAAAAVYVCALDAQQRALSGKLIRLHVVAASDLPEDQARKLLVRDAVLRSAQTLLADADDPRRTLENHLSELARCAQQALEEDGRAEAVTVRLGAERFPTRRYASFSLPAGVYESLRICIGPAEGRNWWCVVFPSLCYAATAGELEPAARAGGFTEGEVRLITGESGEYVLKFRILELLQAVKRRLFPSALEAAS